MKPCQVAVTALMFAGPALASTQLGFLPLPEIEYRSAKRCLKALDAIQRDESRTPQPGHEVTRQDGMVNIIDTHGAEWRTRAYSCRGATLVGSQGGGIAQTYPPQP